MKKLIAALVIALAFCLPAIAAEVVAEVATDWTIVFGVVISALLAVSEALALIPGVKSNSVFQLVSNFLAKLAGK